MAMADRTWLLLTISRTRSRFASDNVFCPHLSRSEEHTSELQSPCNLVCRLLLEKKKLEVIVEAAVRQPGKLHQVGNAQASDASFAQAERCLFDYAIACARLVIPSIPHHSTMSRNPAPISHVFLRSKASRERS